MEEERRTGYGGEGGGNRSAGKLVSLKVVARGDGTKGN